MSVVLAAAAAAVGGPLVLALVRHTTSLEYAPGPGEIAAATAVAGTTTGLVLHQEPMVAVALLPVAILGGAAAVVDAREGRLPDMLTGPLLAASLLAVVLADRSLVGVGAALGLLLLIKAVAGAAIGWGDVKLLPSLIAALIVCGAVVRGVVLMALLVAVSAVLVGLCPGRRSALVPFGPALVVGTLVAAAAG